MQSLEGRTFAITGASGNLGGAVRDLLLARGANLVLLDRSAHRLPEGEGTDRVLALGGLDLTDAAAIGQALDAAVGRFGRFDGLVATVGGFRVGGAGPEDGWEPWERMLTANLKTAVAALQAVRSRLASGGRIVTVGARPALGAGKGVAAYAASKAAILRLTESLAEELKDQGITVNSVLPSAIDTPENRKDMPEADHGRWVPPQDIAEVIAFLLSDAARSVTGAHIPVYGKA